MPNEKKPHCQRPRNFIPAGVVKAARLELTTPSFIEPKKRVTGARAAGVRYEKKVQRYLLDIFPYHYIASPWFSYISENADRRMWCQPDGLLMDLRAGLITIVEIKLRHTNIAWWQTRQLYEPVVRFIFGENLWWYNVLEIVRWYDPDVQFPERYKLIPEIGGMDAGKFGVHIWKPNQ